MDKELIQEYQRRFDNKFSLPKKESKVQVWNIDLSEENLHQQEFANRIIKKEAYENDVFYLGALIFYGYRLGVFRLKDKNECFTRQGGYRDNAILPYNLDEILDEETVDDNSDSHTSNIIEWITNPGSNTDVAQAVIGKMIIPLVKNLCRATPPGKRIECTVVMPPISKDIEIQNWSELFAGVKEKIQINIVNYGHLLTLSEDDRQYIFQHQTDGLREFVIVSAYEVIKGYNVCLGSLAFDVNNFDRQYILQDVRPISFMIDNRQQRQRYEKREKIEKKNDWKYISGKYSVNSRFNSFLGNHTSSFGREMYKLSGVDDFYDGVNEIKKVFHKNEALQVIEVCARLLNEQNLYNIALGDLVYVANILQRCKAFKTVLVGTKKDYKLGTYNQFAPLVDINKIHTIPSNYSTFSWQIKDKRKNLIPYFKLDAKKHNENQIIESVVEHFEHCTTERVADELLYLFKNGEDPSAFFVAKVFMYMSQMDSLKIESRNEIITSIENVDDVQFKEIDKSHIKITKPTISNKKQRSPSQHQSNIYVLDKNIRELNLSVRSYNCLNRAGIYTVRDIVKKSRADLAKVRNLGKKNQDEVVAKIHKLGLKFAGE